MEFLGPIRSQNSENIFREILRILRMTFLFQDSNELVHEKRKKSAPPGVRTQVLPKSPWVFSKHIAITPRVHTTLYIALTVVCSGGTLDTDTEVHP